MVPVIVARARRGAAGFTLVEMAVVLALLGFIATLLSMVLPDLRRSAMAQAGIAASDEAHRALRAHAFVHGRLPCPDTDADGRENVVAGGCAQASGELPWLDLGRSMPLRNGAGLALRYAVYDRPDAAADARLGVLLDRLQPTVAEGLPPVAAARARGQQNQLDFCAALQAGQQSGANVNQLHVDGDGGIENVAYALVDPGVADMDGDGSAFDGTNGAGVRLEHPTRAGSRRYDDRVTVAWFADLWEESSCTGLVAVASRAHPHGESLLALFRQGVRDYQEQLRITRQMAEADRLQEIAAIAGAAAGVANAAAALPTGIAQALNTFGAMSAGAVSAGIALGLNIAATVSAGVSLAIGETNRNAIDGQLSTLATMIGSLDTLHASVRERAIASDAQAFSSQ